jgi:hypothetical protein
MRGFFAKSASAQGRSMALTRSIISSHKRQFQVPGSLFRGGAAFSNLADDKGSQQSIPNAGGNRDWMKTGLAMLGAAVAGLGLGFGGWSTLSAGEAHSLLQDERIRAIKKRAKHKLESLLRERSRAIEKLANHKLDEHSQQVSCRLGQRQ